MPTGVYDRPLIKKCSYVGCEKQSKAKGMCNTHNERIRRNGTVELLNPPDRRPAVERIMDNIEIVPESGCWIWMGPGGETHGNIKIYGVRTPGRVHRIMWEHVNGPVPSGLQVCHKCDIGFCCNPKHLFIMKSLADHEAERVEALHWDDNEPVLNGLACPRCGEEMWDSQPMSSAARITKLPKKAIHCTCGYRGYRVA